MGGKIIDGMKRDDGDGAHWKRTEWIEPDK